MCVMGSYKACVYDRNVKGMKDSFHDSSLLVLNIRKKTQSS